MSLAKDLFIFLNKQILLVSLILCYFLVSISYISILFFAFFILTLGLVRSYFSGSLLGCLSESILFS